MIDNWYITSPRMRPACFSYIVHTLFREMFYPNYRAGGHKVVKTSVVEFCYLKNILL